MAAVHKRAEQRVRYGFELAEQGATYLARAEFIAALKLIAQADDSQQGSRTCTKAVTAGLLALKESSDFFNQGAGIEDPNVAHIVSGHKTAVLKDVDVSELIPMMAARRYHAYAEEQLAAATAHEMSGSMALFGMGKIALVAVGNKSQRLENVSQARSLYRASLIAEPRNFRAANELGVLLAEDGQLELARDLLIRSVSLSPQIATWKNLATVHTRMGEKKLAENAVAQAAALKQTGRGNEGPAVQWVDPQTFAATAPATGDLIQASATFKTPPTSAANAPASNEPAGTPAKKGITDWLPWNQHR